MPVLVFAAFRHSLRHPRLIKLVVINFCIGYIFLLSGIYLYEIYLEHKLLSFDLNRDGIFSGDENTVEQGSYMSLLINDTARRFAPIVGIIFSFTQSILFYLVLYLYDRHKVKY